MRASRILLLTTGVVLTTASQLGGAGGLRIGVMLLGLWMVVSWTDLLFASHGLIRRSELLFLFSRFWGAALVLLSVGAFVALMTGYWDDEGGFRDSFALSFVALFSITIASVGIDRNDALRIAWALLALSSVCLTLLWLIGQSRASIGPIELWDPSGRFSGWSKNPNQIALPLVVAPFVALQLLREPIGRFRKILLPVFVVSFIVVGIASGSDALFVSWAGGAVLLAVLFWWRLVHARSGMLAVAIGWIIVPAAAVVLMIVYVIPAVLLVIDVVSELYTRGGQGQVRIAVWANGIEAVMHSPVFGFGPGGHSGVFEPFSNYEAHNTFIDWASSTGLIGMLLLIFLLAHIAWSAFRSQSDCLFAAIAAMTAFGMLHYIIRHPLVWAYLAVICVLSAAPVRSNVFRSRPVSVGVA